MMKALFVFVFFVEMLISTIFFNNIADRKKSFPVIIGCGTILFEIGAFINNCLISTVWLNVLFSFLVNLLFSSLFFKIKRLRSAFYSVLLVALSTFIEMIVVFIISSLTNLYIVDYDSQTILLVVEILISKILYFLLSMILVKFSQKDNSKIQIPLVFYLFPIITSVAVIGFWYISLNQYIEYKNQIILAIISILLFFATVFIFFAFQAHAQKENKIILLQQEQAKIKTDISYYEILEKQNTDLRIYAHDAKNHISAIKNLNDDPEIDSYVSEMLESLEKHINVSHSGNRILDVIINKYITECNIHNIKFTFDVKNNNLSNLEYHDTVAILGNLLDNAIEAAQLSEKRNITFETDYRNNYSVIIISNSCDNQPLFDDNKTPITTKPNKALHGFGLKSVKKVIKKYSGDFALEYDENKKNFIVTAMLNLNK